MINYEFLSLIGKGSCGEVYKALYKKTAELVAIKVIDLEGESESTLKKLEREIKFLKDCNDPHIVTFYESFINGLKLFIVMEYAIGGSVRDILSNKKKLDEYYISILMRELLLSLKYLHGEKKVHRDIKTSNILLTNNGEVKIADFGVSAQLSDTIDNINSYVGTIFWMAPEILQDKPEYGVEVDIWSVGITAYELAIGSVPYENLTPFEVLKSIKENDPPRITGNCLILFIFSLLKSGFINYNRTYLFRAV